MTFEYFVFPPLHIFFSICTCAHTQTHTHTCTTQCKYTYLQIYVCIYVYMYVCMYVVQARAQRKSAAQWSGASQQKERVWPPAGPWRSRRTATATPRTATRRARAATATGGAKTRQRSRAQDAVAAGAATRRTWCRLAATCRHGSAATDPPRAEARVWIQRRTSLNAYGCSAATHCNTLQHTTTHSQSCTPMWWLQVIRFIHSYVSFAKEPNENRPIFLDRPSNFESLQRVATGYGGCTRFVGSRNRNWLDLSCNFGSIYAIRALFWKEACEFSLYSGQRMCEAEDSGALQQAVSALQQRRTHLSLPEFSQYGFLLPVPYLVQEQGGGDLGQSLEWCARWSIFKEISRTVLKKNRMSRGAFCDLSTLMPTKEYGRYRRHWDSSGTTPANFRSWSPWPHPDSSCSMQSSLSVPESLTTKCVLDSNGDGDCKCEVCVLERLSERIGQQHAHDLSAHKPKFRCTLCQEGRRQGEIDLGFDWCCLYYSIRNRIVALLEALFARIFCRGGGCIDLQSCHSAGQHWIRGELVSIRLWGGTSVRQRVFRLGLIDAQ